MNTKNIRRIKIKKRIRKAIFGTDKCPRLTVFRSNRQIYSQLIDDSTGNTLLAVSSRMIALKTSKTKKEIASKTGILIAQKAINIGIHSVVFDRNGYLYHGRVKELADAARNGGLKF